MKKAILLAVSAMFAVLMLAPAAFADMEDTNGTMMEADTVMMEDDTVMMEDTDMNDTMMVEDTNGVSGTGTGDDDLPDSGGPAILLPAAALLLGSGILTFAVLRRK